MATAWTDDVEALVERSADPTAVRIALDRLVDAVPGSAERLRTEPALAEAVVAVSAASRSLPRVLERDPDALGVLADLDRRPEPVWDDRAGLAAWKRRELLRIAARDLLGLDPLEDTTAALALLANDVLDGACQVAEATTLAVIGMGKLGGRELNYASDVDVLFAGPPGDPPAAEKAARTIMEITRDSFRIDANLRPQGRDGPLVRTIDSYRAYWERWALPWEFQALLKARPSAGDVWLGSRFDEAARSALWSRTFDADDLRSLRALKARAEALLARRGLAQREIKRGQGGIRDIEFSVQLLQLVHGRHDPDLRSPTTLVALDELGEAGYVDVADARALADAYRFLRVVEHRLQLVEEHQVHALPADPAGMARLARVLGYRDAADASAAELFERDLTHHRSITRSIHERLYFRPLLEAFAGATGVMRSQAADERLAAFGFTEAVRTRQAVAELTRGLTRTSRLMQQLLPLLLEWLSESPDPDLGLLGLRTLASGPVRSAALVQAFRESTETARRLCLVLGTSRLLGNLLEHHPDVVPTLGHDETLAPLPADALVDRAEAAMAWRADPSSRHAALRRWKERELLRVACADVLGRLDTAQVGESLTALAEATLQVSLDVIAPKVPFAIVALGRFGGAELSYASDLDVIFVYEGSGAADFAEAERVATGLRRFVGGSTPVGRLYEIDCDLRPEGRQGPLARSLEGYATYFERWALVWERQAMLRSRPVAGDPAVAMAFAEIVENFVWGGLSDDDVREIRRIKARVERERIPAGDDPQFHLKLGRGSLSDVEFTAQLLQLRSQVPGPGTMTALSRLADGGVLDPADRDILSASYRYCERTRNRWYLIRGGPANALPQLPEQMARLARSLGTDPGALREEYRKVTRRARAVVERVFYGRT